MNPTPEELRAIPLDTLRTWYVDACELSSVRQVAAAAGVGRTTLHQFINGRSTPLPRVRRLLALFYVQQQREE